MNVAGYFGVSHTHKMIVVAFRGSTNYRNWVANLNTLTVCHLDQPLACYYYLEVRVT